VLPQGHVDPVGEFASIGVVAFTTTRDAGDFGIPPDGPGPVEQGRWEQLLRGLSPAARLASARQVHGRTVVTHSGDWTGWRRVDGADGHVTATPATILAVSVADCVPIFLAHPNGAVGLLHAGWRGVAGRMLDAGLDAMAALGAPPNEVRVHLGPAISGRNYEVGPDVYQQLTGWETVRPRSVDLRALLAEQARERGVVHLSASIACTRDDPRFFSHRGGDAGRQVAVIVRGRND
jgi:YfiH family protein